MPEPRLRVDPDDPTPAFEQVRRGVRDLVATGALRPGDRLPPLRQLAGDLGLAVGTVARAYAELEQEGLLVSRRGAGTRVAAGVLVAGHEVLDRLARDYLERTRAVGLPDDEALEAVRRLSRG
ncbi:MAG: GntR family transcriptional regulator [Nocardioides sp.]|uniref:GntR family transcriptional regulator n=1 Tax=Nocardioides sp. TaxID=35761 RepID=UPI003F07008F